MLKISSVNKWTNFKQKKERKQKWLIIYKKDVNRKEDSKSDSSDHGDITSLFLLATLMFAAVVIGIMNNNNLSDKTSAIAMFITITEK